MERFGDVAACAWVEKRASHFAMDISGADEWLLEVPFDTRSTVHVRASAAEGCRRSLCPKWSRPQANGPRTTAKTDSGAANAYAWIVAGPVRHPF